MLSASETFQPLRGNRSGSILPTQEGYPLLRLVSEDAHYHFDAVMERLHALLQPGDYLVVPWRLKVRGSQPSWDVILI